MTSLPLGVRLWCLRGQPTNTRWRVIIFLLTLLIYATFHASRKPISVVKSVLHPNCSEIAHRDNKSITPENATFCMWKPFDTDNYNVIYGYLDLSYLLSYAVGMFLSGHIAERMDIRIFLTWGCIFSGLTTAAFGLGYFASIHSLPFYFLVQIAAGFVQSSGWPAVVTCIGNWFGKKRRGLILGLWNCHISVGNILGSLLAGVFVDFAWGWSFVVPGILVACMGVITFLFLVPYPEELGFPGPNTIVKPEEQEYEETSPLQPSAPPIGQTDRELLLQPEGSTSSHRTANAVSFGRALAVPGVAEYSTCLFFLKATTYIFLFWLPKYLKEANGFEAALSADISAVFDIGGILGGIAAGLITDRLSCFATVCAIMTAFGMPALYVYYLVGVSSVGVCIFMLLSLGFLIVGPYSLITTAISADLGTDQTLPNNAKALSTIVAIIDGTGSLGAAIGPFAVGLLVDHGWYYVFVLLISCLGLSILCLLRRILRELRERLYSSVQYVAIS